MPLYASISLLPNKQYTHLELVTKHNDLSPLTWENAVPFLLRKLRMFCDVVMSFLPVFACFPLHVYRFCHLSGLKPSLLDEESLSLFHCYSRPLQALPSRNYNTACSASCDPLQTDQQPKKNERHNIIISRLVQHAKTLLVFPQTHVMYTKMDIP